MIAGNLSLPYVESVKGGPWWRDDLVKFKAGQEGLRIVVVSTFNARYAAIADAAKENWIAYCRHNGYALRFYPDFYHEDPARPETFGDKCKHEIYYDVRGQADYVMFLDIDSLFMNFDVRVEDRIGHFASTPFWFTYDDSGPLSGLWIARTDDTTEKRLRRIYEYAAMTNNVRHGKIEPNGISDQDAMRALMSAPPFAGLLQDCSEARFAGHTFPETYYDGAWIIGFPGCSPEEKLALIKAWLLRAPQPEALTHG